MGLHKGGPWSIIQMKSVGQRKKIADEDILGNIKRERKKNYNTKGASENINTHKKFKK